MTFRIRRWIFPTAVALLALGACKGAETPARADSTGAQTTPEAKDSALTSQNAVLQAQKDSLFGATRGLLAAIASIDSATTAAGVKPAKGKGEPIAAYEEGVRQRTVQALARLRATQTRLRATVARVEKLGGLNAQMKAQLDTFRLTAAALQEQIRFQQARGDSLVQQLALSQARGDSLAGRTRVLGSTIDSMTTENQRVFVASGTRDFLLKHHIIEEVGGSRFPLIVKLGATVRPNSHPDSTQFKAFDMMSQRVLPIDSTTSYEVVSTQDLNGADRTNAHRRVFKGTIRITDPVVFWKPSHYLILMRQ